MSSRVDLASIIWFWINHLITPSNEKISFYINKRNNGNLKNR